MPTELFSMSSAPGSLLAVLPPPITPPASQFTLPVNLKSCWKDYRLCRQTDLGLISNELCTLWLVI